MAFTDFTEGADAASAGPTAALGDLGDRIVLGSDFPEYPTPISTSWKRSRRLDLGRDWNEPSYGTTGVRLLAAPG